MMRAMVARSMSTATISFGMVIDPDPALLGERVAGRAISFNLLHGKCHSRLKQQYVCPKDEEIVTRDQMVKGYEFAKDQYVIFTEDEIKAMEEEASKTIEITEFVPLAKVDPIYFDRRLLPRARQGRREGLPAAVRGHAADRPLRARQVGGARQAVPRADPAHRQRARHAAAALRGRGAALLARCRSATPR